MHPQAYIDLRVVPSFKAERPNAMAHDVMSLLVKFTHAIAARQAFKHALAFPLSKIGEKPSPGNIARVFALERESLESLADELEKQQFIRDYVSIGRVKVLAADYKPAGYVEYRRFRIPNREKASRARLMAIADSLPYLRVNSSSTGHGFSLYVKPIRHSTASCAQDTPPTFEPDIYGLSVSKRRFALPLTPEDGWPGQGGESLAAR
ncbi:MAG: type I-F CRISPR-associated endoribonuclease Cas6/Csy4 [Ramlibacter sp.]|nr:type I-F CRISPR-associated endoribonuclease Cas6/Csy4 [Ramlibacter sp.]